MLMPVVTFDRDAWPDLARWMVSDEQDSTLDFHGLDQLGMSCLEQRLVPGNGWMGNGVAWLGKCPVGQENLAAVADLAGFDVAGKHRDGVQVMVKPCTVHKIPTATSFCLSAQQHTKDKNG